MAYGHQYAHLLPRQQMHLAPTDENPESRRYRARSEHRWEPYRVGDSERVRVLNDIRTGAALNAVVLHKIASRAEVRAHATARPLTPPSGSSHRVTCAGHPSRSATYFFKPSTP